MPHQQVKPLREGKTFTHLAGKWAGTGLSADQRFPLLVTTCSNRSGSPISFFKVDITTLD